MLGRLKVDLQVQQIAGIRIQRLNYLESESFLSMIALSSTKTNNLKNAPYS
jgi:hypothetical protein